MQKLITLIFLGVIWVFDAKAANILGITPLKVTSHFNVIQPVFLELANRGHNVTVISGQRDDNIPSNYRLIEVNLNPEIFKTKENVNMFDVLKGYPSFISGNIVRYLMLEITELTLKSTNVKEFLENDISHFDLVICEDFFIVPYYMLAYKYKAPLVTYTTHSGAHYINDYMGNPLNLQYNPNMFVSSFGRLTLWEKLENVFCTAVDILAREIFYMPRYNQIARDVFSHLPQPLPDLRDIEKNTSLHLLNTHFSMDTVRSYLPNMVEMGGIHLQKTKPLPEDLQKIMDSAKYGVIYFSMGSNLKSSQMSNEKKTAFIESFSKVKQLVLWKFEDNELPGKPNNVVIRKWFPQNDILAHPNVHLFITHGGLLSIMESISFGVPIIGIPIFGDQIGNIAKAKYFGYGEELDFQTLTADIITKTVEKVLNDPSYRTNAKETSIKLQDTPLTVMESVMFWIEYVIKHKGAYHLKTPSIRMTWYEYYLVDVILILLVGLLVFLIINYYSLKYIISLLFKNKINEKKVLIKKKKF